MPLPVYQSIAPFALLFAAAAFAQESSTPARSSAPANKADIAVEARLVVLPAVVRDKHRALIANLGKPDFTISVDGQPQAVRYFDHDANAPLTLGLLVDTSMSQRTVLEEERKASSAFLDDMLATPAQGSAADEAFVVQFARSVELLQDVTTSRPKLQEALQQLDTSAPSFTRSGNDPSDDNSNGSDRNSGSGGRRGAPGSYRGGGTTLYDAVFLASEDVAARHKGRRALVLLTDGVDRGSKESLTAAIESAQRKDVIVYAIYYKGESPRDYADRGDRNGGMGRRGGGGGWPGSGGGGWPGGGGGSGRGSGGNGGGRGREPEVDGRKILDRMCNETGGRMFEVSKKQPVDAVYKQIGEELRAQYRLGFTPSGDAAADGYHRVDLAVTGAHAKDKLDIQTRDGYYTGK